MKKVMCKRIPLLLLLINISVHASEFELPESCGLIGKIILIIAGEGNQNKENIIKLYKNAYKESQKPPKDKDFMWLAPEQIEVYYKRFPLRLFNNFFSNFEGENIKTSEKATKEIEKLNEEYGVTRKVYVLSRDDATVFSSLID